jgi:hypothetical protein
MEQAFPSLTRRASKKMRNFKTYASGYQGRTSAGRKRLGRSLKEIEAAAEK